MILKTLVFGRVIVENSTEICRRSYGMLVAASMWSIEKFYPDVGLVSARCVSASMSVYLASVNTCIVTVYCSERVG